MTTSHRVSRRSFLGLVGDAADILRRLLDSRLEKIQTRADIYIAARPCVQIGGTEFLQLLLGLDELVVILLRLLFNECKS